VHVDQLRTDATDVPRPEYPRPQFVRDEWLNLNGWWQFETDPGDSGWERGLASRDLGDRILVPFCPEAPLSGVGLTDRVAAVWYRREFVVPEAWDGRRILLHFQAVDYEATVWVNGTEVGMHKGGFTPFSCDVTRAVSAGAPATVVVRARDPWWAPQPRGKQAAEFVPHGALYGRTTGIWQTVWIEPVGSPSLERPRLTTDVVSGTVRLEQVLSRSRPGLTVTATLGDGAGEVVRGARPVLGELGATIDLVIPEGRRRLWRLDDPFLYSLRIELRDDEDGVLDAAGSYVGLRSVGVSGRRLLVNGEPVFQRLVLDQGFYPDGILTAPTDEALVDDITLSQAAGFNGARLHQKVFEERFLYHADRLGYIVWGEFADWGCSGYGPLEDHQQPSATYITQWLEALARDYSHPCIVGWCPLNETRQPLSDRLLALDDVTRGMFLATKAVDRTRPVIDASGYSHRVAEADVYDSHDYEQDVDTFRRNHEHLGSGEAYVNRWKDRDISVPYDQQPYLVSEFGGAWWSEEGGDGSESWGYGQRPKSVEEFFERFRDLCGVLLDNPAVAGYCYTQLTDVYQEHNGVLTFDRHPKVVLDRLKAVQDRQAAMERPE